MHASVQTNPFETARPQLLGLAYRILGVFADAEDIVQDTWIAWMQADREAIDAPAAWLRAVCARRAIDRLRKVKRARTDYVGEWLPEPAIVDFGGESRSSGKPDEVVELANSVSYAFLVVLDSLAPKERAAFLLREVFSLDFAEVADCLDVGEAAARKLVSRARRNLDKARERDRLSFRAPEGRRQDLLGAFEQAIATGETAVLARLLSEDVRLTADGGGKAIAVLRPLVGQAEALGFIGGVLSPVWRRGELRRVMVNADPALALFEAGRLTALASFAFNAQAEGAAILIVRNPDKLARLERELAGEGAK
ncbi:MAG: sigma-70 family RNA polymerase sigma factor [Rhodobacteraceae bacterium]|nr:sigma-70 family RNA polymerase sigma factor [Paracoccaceae bacterium]